MKSRIQTQKKRTKEQTPDYSTTPAQPMFQSRSFVAQSQTAQKSDQQDLKTQLKQANKYGHNLSGMHRTGVSAGKPVQQKQGKGQNAEQRSMKAPKAKEQEATWQLQGGEKKEEKGMGKSALGGHQENQTGKPMQMMKLPFRESKENKRRRGSNSKEGDGEEKKKRKRDSLRDFLKNLDPRAGEPARKGGGAFTNPGGKNRMETIDNVRREKPQKGEAFKSGEGNDTTEYFNGRLKVDHQGEGIEKQEDVADKPVKKATGKLDYKPTESTAWLQEPGVNQTVKRESEKKIMGGTAKEAKEKAGYEGRTGDAWAHIRPDHTQPENREEKGNRHPASMEANTQHTVIEDGTRRHIERFGAMGVGRQLGGEKNEAGMSENMRMQIEQPTEHGFNSESHLVDFQTRKGARGGDGTAVGNYLDMRHFKALARDVGEMPESSEEESSTESSVENEERGRSRVRREPEERRQQRGGESPSEMRRASDELYRSDTPNRERIRKERDEGRRRRQSRRRRRG